jgi:flagellar basal-body rod protein FlgB
MRVGAGNRRSQGRCRVLPMSCEQAGRPMIDLERDTALTHKLLDVLDLRARVAQHNIANQNTPGFKRYTVRFEDLLRDQMHRGGDAGAVEPQVERDESGPPDQNNVDLVQETTLLDKVRLVQEFVTRRAGSYFSTLNRAIFGR